MKSFWSLAMVLGLACGAASCAADPDVEVEGARQAAASAAPRGYHVIKLRGLGGTTSNGNTINDLGWVLGVSTLAEDVTTHATLWIFGFPFDLGTLGDPASNSAVLWPVRNVRGLISGITEVKGDDPLGEDWSCSAFIPKTPGHVCRGFVWERGRMRALPTLGGPNGFATGTNDRGETVGWAENNVLDPTCNQVTQFRQFKAVVWGPGAGQPRVLPPLDGDSTSAATAINDRGQVVGISGDCSNAVGERSARHAVLWDHGVPRDLGSLGGVAWNTPMAMNEAGDVVGFANAPGTEPPTRFNYRAFLWTAQDGMVDLGTLPGDTRAQATGINARRQVVGFSRGTVSHGFIWENGVMTDLNDAIVSGSRDTIRFASDINDFGIITGTSIDAAGARSTFIAIPIRP